MLPPIAPHPNVREGTRELYRAPMVPCTLKQARERWGESMIIFGGVPSVMLEPGVSDEEFLLRYIMKGEQEVAAMHAAGPPKQYFNTTMPLLTLIQELDKHRKVRYVQVRRGSDSVLIRNRA